MTVIIIFLDRKCIIYNENKPLKSNLKSNLTTFVMNTENGS